MANANDILLWKFPDCVVQAALEEIPGSVHFGDRWIVFADGFTPPTDSEFAAIEAEYFAKQAINGQLSECYAQRKAAYGPIEDQLDFGSKNGFDALAVRNLAIKAQFPKPEAP